MQGSVQVHAPKQERSLATYQSLLDAAEQLLAERRLEEITVAHVVARAGSSVGSFYARFPGKEALVVALVERYHEDTRAVMEALLADGRLKTLSLRARARRFIALLVESCRKRRGLLRLRFALRLSRSIALPDEDEKSRALVDAVEQIFEPAKKEIRHRDKSGALAFALRMVDATAGTILVEEVSDSYGTIADDEMVDRLTDAFVAYLT